MTGKSARAPAAPVALPLFQRQIDLAHDPIGLGQYLHDLLIVPDIVP